MPSDFRQFDALTARFAAAGKNAPVELRRALISSQRAAKTEFSRAARQIYNVKAGSFANNFSVSPPNESRLSYEVIGEKRGITVAAFGARAVKKGLSVQIKKAGGRTVITGSFFPSAGNKSGVPFKRDGRSRLPISVVYGPSVADMIKAKSVHDPAIKTTKERLSADIEKRINRIIKRG